MMPLQVQRNGRGRASLLTILAAIFLMANHASAEGPMNFPPDIVVAADGSGQFTSVHAAVQSIPKDNRQRIVIFVKDGVYKEKVRVDAACVSIIGQSRAGTRIEFPQLNDDFQKNPDEIGRAVINVEGDDFVMQNLTAANTAGIVGPHSFVVYGKADRTVITDCDLLSEGADTLSLWEGRSGRYFHARLHVRGAVDFVCPRGWCYIEDSTFFETKATAAMWHDGRYDRDMKFVLRNCKFDGVEGWHLARHHHDAQFYFLDCQFSRTMTDRAPYRVIYPLGTAPATQADIDRNRELDKTNQWGERAYFHNCRRDGGDYPWHADNLAAADGSPQPEQITAAWTFAGKWDPKRATGPRVVECGGPVSSPRRTRVVFSEPVTVKGAPVLVTRKGDRLAYVSGSGTETLLFDWANDPIESIDSSGGAIIACEAAERIVPADLTLPN